VERAAAHAIKQEPSVSRIERIALSLRDLRFGHVLLELMLLIAGILIALAVNGWIEERREARTEHLYLERLARDLDQDLAVIEEFAEFERRQTDDAVLAYKPLCGGQAGASKDDVARALDHLTTRRTVRLVRATYADLVATGNLGLIKDPGLRDRIVKLYEANERWTAIVDRNNQVYVDQVYTTYMIGAGLISPSPDSNLLPSVAPRQKFSQLLGAPARERVDRVWHFAAGSQELDVFCGTLWFRGFVSMQGIDQARTVAEQIGGVRGAIAAVLGEDSGRTVAP
jgi:hypothetical protein